VGHDSCWKIKKRSVQHYNLTADTYNRRYREEQKRKYRAALEALDAPKGDYILDLGCGTGLFIEEAVELEGYIIGVDCSKNMIKKAKHEHGDRRVSLLCADADHLPFVEGAFDKVFSFTLLQNMPSPERTVVEICRVARRGSEVVLSATKKGFTGSSFLRLLNEERLTVVELIDGEESKDYIAICRTL